MSKAEFVDLSGLRVDGRRPHELRKLSAKLGIVPRATGSAMLDHGHTKILATVYGPRECSNRARERHDRSIVNCDVVMAPFAQVPGQHSHQSRRCPLRPAVCSRGLVCSLGVCELRPHRRTGENDRAATETRARKAPSFPLTHQAPDHLPLALHRCICVCILCDSGMPCLHR